MQACSFDIRKFHRTCPVIPHHKPWLVVQGTNNDFFIDHGHPFGAASASSNAGMMGNAIIDIWIREGVNPIVKYEDDVNVYRLPVPHGRFVDGGFSYDYDKHEAARRIASLHVPWHEAKGDPEFLFVQTYIGFLWDLPNHSVSLPPAKLVKFRERVRIFLDCYDGHRVPLREVDKIHGSLCHVSFVYTDGRSYLASLSNFAASFNGNEHSTRYPPRSMLTDLRWWLHALSEPTPHVRHLRPRGPLQDLDIYVDASTSWGIGILIEGRWAAFRLKSGWKIPGRDICWLESLAIELLFHFLEGMGLRDANLLVHSDSQGAIGAFEKGRCPNWHINLVVRRSFPLMARLHISPTFKYIESARNPADPLSRGILGLHGARIPHSIQLPSELLPFLSHV